MTPDHAPAPNESSPSHFRRADLAPLALLLGSLIAVFWKVLFTSSMLFYRDVCNYTYPTARLIHELCRRGFLPYWNPFLNYGQPILANPNLLFFYPYTIFIVLFPVDWAYTFHYLTHFALAGVGAYLLARGWGQSRAAAFFAGFCFTFCGPVLSLGNVYNHAACAAWTPWALLCTDRAVEGRGLRPWILLTLVFSLQFLAGEPLTLVATFGLSLAYALYRLGAFRRLWAAPNLRVLGAFFLVGCLMVALCAVQFLPASDLLSHSRRGTQGLRYRETANWAVNPGSLVEVVIPDFYGTPLSSPTAWTWLMADRNVPYFQATFLGFVPLFFSVAGWALGRDRRRNFVAGAALLLLLLSFGHFTPVFALAYLLVPLLELVRYPVKLLVPVMLLVALLAGWGVDALRGEMSEWRPRRNRLVLPLKLLLALVAGLWVIAWAAPTAIAGPTRSALLASGERPDVVGAMKTYLLTMLRLDLPGLAGFALAGLLCVLGLEQKKTWPRKAIPTFALLGLVQLLQVNYKANPTVPKSFYTYQPPLLSEFQDPPGSYRLSSVAQIPLNPTAPRELRRYVNFDSIPAAAGLSPLALGAFQDRLLLATGSMYYHVEGSINLDLERSLPPYLYDLEIYLNRQAPDALHADCLLGRTNVKYLVEPERRDSPAVRELGEVPNGSPKPSYLYQDLCFLPRAYAASASRFTTSSLETLRQLSSPDFDARQVAILAQQPGTAPALDSAAPAGDVEIVGRDPNSVTLRADLSRPAYVLLLERYDPSWRARVDGRETAVLRANQLFRAVYVQEGRHEVFFYYHQQGLIAGLLISLVAAGSLAAAYALDL